MKRLFAAFVTSSLLIAATAVAVEAAWWNPMASRETSRTSMPLINGRPLQSSSTFAPAANGPSVVQRMTSSTKKVVSGTVDVITLKPLRDKMSGSPPPPKQTWGVAQPWNPTANRPQPKKSGPFSFVGNVFKSHSAEEASPRTPQEFLSQPRPGDTGK